MSLLEEIRNAQVGHLDLDPHVAVEESTPVREVVAQMGRLDRTTTLVSREGRLTGIFTERDVLRKVVTRPENWERPIREIMTPDPVGIAPDSTILAALRVMTDGYFRDLPVLGADGKILGNLTDNAIVRHLADCLPEEVLNLPPNPNQVPEAPEGA